MRTYSALALLISSIGVLSLGVAGKSTITASNLSLVTFGFWVVAGVITFAVCIINARKTRGGKFSSAFLLLGLGTVLLAVSGITISFFGEKLGRDIAQIIHDAGFVIGFILVLAASNRFLRAMTG